MSARFEIVRSDAEQPWHARFVAANGRVVWTTEQYARRAGARKAIAAMSPGTVLGATLGLRDVDARTPPPPTPDITARGFGTWI